MSQRFKTIYFPDHPAEESNKKNVTLAFREKDIELFEKIQKLSSEDLRNLIKIYSFKDLKNRAVREDLPINTYCIRLLKEKTNANNTFIINPIHATFKSGKNDHLQRWYPFLEGYSPKFVETIINQYFNNPKTIYDPFSGSGTSVVTASKLGYKSLYSEINPFLQFLTGAKITALSLSAKQKKSITDLLYSLSENLYDFIEKSEIDCELENNYKAIFENSQYFTGRVFKQILKSRSLVTKISCLDYHASQMLMMAFLTSLIPSSLLVRAGDLRYKTERERDKGQLDFIKLASQKIIEIAEDIEKSLQIKHKPLYVCSDAKLLNRIPPLGIDSVITSPPYLNGTNYFRNTKIELWYMKCLRTEYDLSEFRNRSITAGINDVKKILNYDTEKQLPSVLKLVNRLKANTYDQRIPIMVDYYFKDMNKMFMALFKHMKKSGRLAIDIGDSIYSGIHVKTNELLSELLEEIGFKFLDEAFLRGRRSKSGNKLKQVLLIFKKKDLFKSSDQKHSTFPWKKKWNSFKSTLPHQLVPFSKRNWGHQLHSLCSYQGKMKPSLVSHLIKTFVREGGSLLDPFVGVGTTTLESALSGIKSFGFEISPAAEAIAKAKSGKPNEEDCLQLILKLEIFIKANKPNKSDYFKANLLNFNKNLSAYYEKNTFNEILLARKYFIKNPPSSVSENLVFASLLHILHGNRPYALSRRSHGITPFAPSGAYIYKSLIDKLKQKVARSLSVEYPENFCESKIFNQDATLFWPQEINNLDAIVTSPPFFDSTRFYLTNWIRLWFSGWEFEDFKHKPKYFIENKQKATLEVYESVFRQARERIKSEGVFIMHLGKSRKCDMANELAKIASKWFKVYDIFSESVEGCESHGIRDKGTVTSHQYLVLH